MTGEDEARRRQLAQFLKGRRDRLDPRDLGLPVRPRRRAPGLLREEVAARAGISTTWYVWLEQGRDVRASAHAVRSVGRALRLSRAEQSYLMQLARPDLSPGVFGSDLRQPSPGLRTILDGLYPNPVYALDRHFQFTAWNAAAAHVFGDFDPAGPGHGNLIARLFLDPDWRNLFCDWEKVARAVVAQYRLAAATGGNDGVFQRQIAALAAQSGDFSRFWATGEVAEPRIWTKNIRHPQAGELKFDFCVFVPVGEDTDITVSIYTPSNGQTKRRLADFLDGNGEAGDAASASR